MRRIGLFLAIASALQAFGVTASLGASNLSGEWDLTFQFPPGNAELPSQLRVQLFQTGFTLTGLVIQPSVSTYVAGRLAGSLFVLTIGPITTDGIPYSLSSRYILASAGNSASGSVTARVGQGAHRTVVTGTTQASLASVTSRSDGSPREGASLANLRTFHSN